MPFVDGMPIFSMKCFAFCNAICCVITCAWHAKEPREKKKKANSLYLMLNAAVYVVSINNNTMTKYCPKVMDNNLDMQKK